MVKRLKEENRVNNFVIKSIKHVEHIYVLFNKTEVRHNMKNIQSKFHIIRTYDVSKIPLSCFNDKRYILDYWINSLVYSHRRKKSIILGEVHKINEIKSRENLLHMNFFRYTYIHRNIHRNIHTDRQTDRQTDRHLKT